MKRLVLSILIIFTTTIAIAQKGLPVQSAMYEAVNWKLWVSGEPNPIKSTSTKNVMQSKAGLQTIKQGLKNPDQKKMVSINYSNACALTYRWHEVLLGLVYGKAEVMLGMPAAAWRILVFTMHLPKPISR